MYDRALLIDGAAVKVYKYNTCFRDKVAQGNGDMLGLLLFKTIIYICTSIKSFKTYFVVIILKFQKWLDVDVFYFKIVH